MNQCNIKCRYNQWRKDAKMLWLRKLTTN